MAGLRSILRYPGGKAKLKKLIVSLFPEHNTFIEVFGGAGHVIFYKEPARRIDVYNDRDDNLVNFFRVVRDKEKAERLAEMIELTPYSRTEHHALREKFMSKDFKDDVEWAYIFYYLLYTSYGSIVLSRLPSFTRSTKSCKTLYNKITLLPAIQERIRRITIENLNCFDLFESYRVYDDVSALLYLDPPYIGADKLYRHDFTLEDHVRLLEELKRMKCMWILSNYENGLYNEHLNRFCFRVKVHNYSLSLTNFDRRVQETLWLNFDLYEHLERQPLLLDNKRYEVTIEPPE